MLGYGLGLGRQEVTGRKEGTLGMVVPVTTWGWTWNWDSHPQGTYPYPTCS